MPRRAQRAAGTPPSAGHARGTRRPSRAAIPGAPGRWALLGLALALGLALPRGLLAAPPAEAAAREPEPGAAQEASAPAAPAGPRSELGFIEQLYQAHDDYRAETEILRFLRDEPAAPERDLAELARARLYYRQGRYKEANVMLYSLLDRFPRGDAAVPAWRLLTFSHLRQGDLGAAGQTLWALRTDDAPAPSLADLQAPPPGAVEPERAVRWSTFLPGAGLFLLGEAGKGTAALGLNVAFLAATVASYRAGLTGPALLFLLIEATVYRGQRQATREEAQLIYSQLRERQTEEWLRTHGEPAALKFGVELSFGGG
jgi:hypothetical protein